MWPANVWRRECVAENITVPQDVYEGVLKPTYARGVRILSNSWSCYFPQVLCDRKRCTPIRSVC